MKAMKRKVAALLVLLLLTSNMTVSAAGAAQVPDNTASAETEAEETVEPTAPVVPTASPEATIVPGDETGETPTPGAEPTEIPGTDALPTETPIAGEEPSIVPDETVSPTPETTVSPIPEASATQAPSSEAEEKSEIKVNFGNGAYDVDGFGFDEGGSCTLQIPELNPFFPYEVQLSHEDKVEKFSFMTPDDSVEFEGHRFYVSAEFDGTAITRMNFTISGNTVVVYPEEKEFAENGITPFSLIPLQEVTLQRIDLSAYTPVELTMVSVDSIFLGDTALEASDKVIWTYDSKYDNDRNYTINSSKDKLDLSYLDSYDEVEMIVGTADQLDSSNVRYIVPFKITDSKHWLTPTIYVQDASGARSEEELSSYDYYSNSYSSYNYHELNIYGTENLRNAKDIYCGLAINNSVFPSTNYSQLKVYEGKYLSFEEAVNGTEITGQILEQDMSQANAGYKKKLWGNEYVTLVSFDENGGVTGCLPVELYLGMSSDPVSNARIYFDDLYETVDGQEKRVDYDESYLSGEAITKVLYAEYDINRSYNLKLSYSGGKDAVTAAYQGTYTSIEEALKEGAVDIKDSLFASYSEKGYGANYSSAVSFTVFVGADGTEGQEIYHPSFQLKKGKRTLNSGTGVHFTGLNDGKSRTINEYVADANVKDSYAEGCYITITVDDTVDLTYLAPEFYTDTGVHLYAEGSSIPEVSGENFHDFSNDAVHYTTSAENGFNSKNVWLSVVKAKSGVGQLYINSMSDSESNTRVENGITYSTREVLLDGISGYSHDIIVYNIGTESIPALSVELDSSVLELDEYWTLSGNHDLAGFTTTITNTDYGELANLAKIRLRAKEGVTGGTEVSGKLVFRSSGSVLLELALTGTIGNPCITTEEIPQAVKYVPYGSMIQNNNKYSWNTVSYELISGRLPAGMVIKDNGELYGVPTEAGNFTFTVHMNNSFTNFTPSTKAFTLTVVENTDPNVDGATDTGYDLTQRVPGVNISTISDETLVSEGVFDEFVDVYLDGTKLTKDVDYTAESGSTRITIRSQTFVNAGTNGIHTIGVEFRTQDTQELKRAAQNYVLSGGTGNSGGNSGGNNGSGGSNAGNNDGDNSGSNNSNENSVQNAGVNSNAESAAGNSPAWKNNIGNGQNGNNALQSGQEISYTIAEGDTLWQLAEKYYGDSAYWVKIFEDNKNIISNPDKIYVGQKITIYLSLTSANESKNGEAQPEPENVLENASDNTYVVQVGDTLWKIAFKKYGKGWQWIKIYIANTDTIKDPGVLRIGQVIKLP